MSARKPWRQPEGRPGGGIAGFRAAAAMCLLAGSVQAESPRDLLTRYAVEARAENPAFEGFSAARGQDFYYRAHAQADGSEYSCASCHHQDPRKEQFAHHDKIPCRACHYPNQHRGSGQTIRRQLLPFAPVANEARFSDPVRVEMWFARNCEFVLARTCTAAEKGDLIQWLLSIPGAP